MATSTGQPEHETDADVSALREQVRTLTEALKAMQAQVERQSRTIADLSVRVAAPGGNHVPEGEAEDEISPDTLVVITAAITAFLGKKVRIRSARRLQSPYEIINPWSQQGRVSVQASHVLRWLE